MNCNKCSSSCPVGVNGKTLICKDILIKEEHIHEVFKVYNKPKWCPKDENFRKLKRIYELILRYNEEYGETVALETIEVSNNLSSIQTIDEFLEELEKNK